MSAEIIQFSEARLRYRARRRAEAVATSPLVVGVAVCCVPVMIAYVVALEIAGMIWRPRG